MDTIHSFDPPGSHERGATRARPRADDKWHIDLGQDWEIRLWTRDLECDEAELRRAVAAVGNLAGDVRWYLGRS